MPELTPRLGIKKPLGTDNVTRQSFNENWDIIDSKVASLGTNGKVPIAQLDVATLAAKTDLTSHQNNTTIHVTAAERNTWNAKAGAEVVTTSANGLMSASDKTKLNGIAANANNYTHPSTHAASMITVADASNVFAGSNVETVLTELFTNANNGKTAVANAVTAMGVPASPTDTFTVLANKVGQIYTGKKWASGSLPVGSAGYITVSGITFKPSVIVCTFEDASGQLKSDLICLSNNSNTARISITTLNNNNALSGAAFYMDTPTEYVNTTGFKLRMRHSSWSVATGVPVNWIAYE